MTEEDQYVAWLRYKRSGDRTTIHICDSDADGAFKVYRHHENQISKIREALECPSDLGVVECAALRTSQAVVYKRHLEEARSHLPTSLSQGNVVPAASVPDTVEAVVSALKGLMECIDKGLLVRDTSHDRESGWAIKQMPVMLAIKAAQEALEP